MLDFPSNYYYYLNNEVDSIWLHKLDKILLIITIIGFYNIAIKQFSDNGNRIPQLSYIILNISFYFISIGSLN